MMMMTIMSPRVFYDNKLVLQQPSRNLDVLVDFIGRSCVLGSRTMEPTGHHYSNVMLTSPNVGFCFFCFMFGSRAFLLFWLIKR